MSALLERTASAATERLRICSSRAIYGGGKSAPCVGLCVAMWKRMIEFEPKNDDLDDLKKFRTSIWKIDRIADAWYVHVLSNVSPRNQVLRAQCKAEKEAVAQEQAEMEAPAGCPRRWPAWDLRQNKLIGISRAGLALKRERTAREKEEEEEESLALRLRQENLAKDTLIVLERTERAFFLPFPLCVVLEKRGNKQGYEYTTLCLILALLLSRLIE